MVFLFLYAVYFTSVCSFKKGCDRASYSNYFWWHGWCDNYGQQLIDQLCNNLNHDILFVVVGQLILRSETRYFSKGSIIADSREEAKGLIVITSGQVFYSC